MNATDLRSVQAPLKAQYKERPETAFDTLRSRGVLVDGLGIRLERPYRAIAGLHPKTGGDGTKACSGDLLLDSLVACAGVTLSAVATALEIEIHSGIVFAEGDLDFRGTLGVSKDVPVGFLRIRLNFEIKTNADKEKLDTLLRLTERYCVVYQTLSRSVQVASNLSVR
jgi:uncharacterized OsmC-like protein